MVFDYLQAAALNEMGSFDVRDIIEDVFCLFKHFKHRQLKKLHVFDILK